MKKMIVIILCLAMVISFAGCNRNNNTNNGQGGNGGGAGNVDIGIVLPTKDEPRWLQDQASFQAAVANSSYKAEVLFSQGNPANERTNVENLVNRGIKVLIICAHDATAAAASVETAKNAGVTVISYDRLITDTDAVDYYVTFDSLAVGAAMGQYLIDNATGTGLPLYLYAGAATDNNAFLFFEGSWSVLQPKIADGTFKIINSSAAVALQNKATLTRDEMSSIIGQVTTNWDFNEARSKAEAHLTATAAADKGTASILAPNDGTARSIADVFAADTTIKGYFITGQDAEKASVQYIIDGKQSMTVFKDTRALATDAMNMALDIIDGKTPATDTTYNNLAKDIPSKQTKVVVVTKENVREVLIDSGYYNASDFTGLE
jgi:putative multiple sugar transport system substrate-binding protein